MKESYQSFLHSRNFYLPPLSAKQLFMECHWPPTSQRSFTPPPTRTPTPASCSLGLVVVVSVLEELCDVGGKRDQGGGSSLEFLLKGGMGWRLSPPGLLLRQHQIDNAALGKQCFELQIGVCILLSRVGTASFGACLLIIRWGLAITLKY